METNPSNQYIERLIALATEVSWLKERSSRLSTQLDNMRNQLQDIQTRFASIEERSTSNDRWVKIIIVSVVLEAAAGFIWLLMKS